MANNNIFKGLKEVIYAMYDDKGRERITYFAPISKVNISDARLTLLKNLCDLVLNTDIVSEWTKMYLRDKNITVKSLTDEINRINAEKNELVRVKVGKELVYGIGEEIPIHTIRSRIDYEQKKLTLALGSKDIIVDILYYPSRSIEEYQLRVANLLAEYRGGKDLRSKVNLSFDTKVYAKTFDGNFMEKYEDILYTYLESTRKAIEEELNKDADFVGYFNYLLSGIHTDDPNVLSDRKSLIELLSGSRNATIKVDTKVVEEDTKEVEVEQLEDTESEVEEVDNVEVGKDADEIETDTKDNSFESEIEKLEEKFSLIGNLKKEEYTDVDLMDEDGPLEGYETEFDSDNEDEFIPDLGDDDTDEDIIDLDNKEEVIEEKPVPTRRVSRVQF